MMDGRMMNECGRTDGWMNDRAEMRIAMSELPKKALDLPVRSGEIRQGRSERHDDAFPGKTSEPVEK